MTNLEIIPPDEVPAISTDPPGVIDYRLVTNAMDLAAEAKELADANRDNDLARVVSGLAEGLDALAVAFSGLVSAIHRGKVALRNYPGLDE